KTYFAQLKLLYVIIIINNNFRPCGQLIQSRDAVTQQWKEGMSHEGQDCYHNVDSMPFNRRLFEA
ncbi:hypothetical protein, partial [Lactobacillus helveticus]|uniref:hypothetical protein n=1 Tax=Lactobacillus helveticus TaxID=1587 RepID=UPI001C26E435